MNLFFNVETATQNQYRAYIGPLKAFVHLGTVQSLNNASLIFFI
jgi:hypothetical protein